MLTPLVWRNASSPHESKGWVAWIDGLSMPHAFIWAKKLLTSPIAGGWESEVNTLNLRFRAGSGTDKIKNRHSRLDDKYTTTDIPHEREAHDDGNSERRQGADGNEEGVKVSTGRPFATGSEVSTPSEGRGIHATREVRERTTTT